MLVYVLSDIKSAVILSFFVSFCLFFFVFGYIYLGDSAANRRESLRDSRSTIWTELLPLVVIPLGVQGLGWTTFGLSHRFLPFDHKYLENGHASVDSSIDASRR